MAEETDWPQPHSLVLAVHVTFADVERAFAEWSGGPTDRHGWLGGEPIGAEWILDGVTVTYSVNQAIGLRVLTSSQPVAHGLPLMTVAEARRLAALDDPASRLLGVTALGIVGGADAVSDLDELTTSGDGPLADAAALAMRRLGMRVLAHGAGVLAERQQAQPEFSALFSALRSTDTRRQVLRWLLQRPPQDRSRLVRLLKTGLHDPDWEVRWTAVIGVGIFGADELLVDLKKCELDDRIERTDRQILEALRQTIGSDLAGIEIDLAKADHLRSCLDGSSKEFDRAHLLLRALRDPLPETATERPPLCGEPGEFCEVEVVLHWVGDPEIAGHPVRSVAPVASFSIMREPTEAVDWPAVPARVAELSAAVGKRLRLPSALELEMACRGPDGRRFPWGNGRWSRLEPAHSPWGLVQPLDSPEWVDTPTGQPAALGGRGTHSCAGPLTKPAQAALRLVHDDRGSVGPA